MDFEDQSFMDVGDTGFFDNDNSEHDFSFMPQPPDPAPVPHSTLYESTPHTTFNRPHQDQAGHANFGPSTARVSKIYKRDARPAPRDQAQSTLTNLQTSLQRIRPVKEQFDARYRSIEARLEARLKQQDHKLKIVTDTITELKEMLKGFEGNVSTAYDTAQILTTFIEKMFPQEEIGSVEGN